MPNWCENETAVTGPTEDITRFLTALRANPVDDVSLRAEPSVSLLATFVPRPAEVEADGTWYEWSLAHWGTKWTDETRIAEVVDHGNGYSDIVLRGDTAWAPPIEGWTAVSALFPTLTFVLTFVEPGMAFGGAAVIADGDASVSEFGHDEFPEPPDDWDDEREVVAYTEALEARVEQALADAQGIPI